MATEPDGDPARTLAVLWRTGGRPARKDLGVDRIVTAAVTLADTEGLAALSMRRVADTLGVGTMSLYTHVPGKAELLDAMVDAVHAETPRPEDVPGGWRGRLTRIARDNRDLLLRHPWLLQVPAGRAVLGPHVIAKYDYELRAVDGIGLTDLEMDSVLTLVLAHVRSAARVTVDAARTRDRTGLTDEQWWHSAAPLLARVLDPARYPLATRVGAAAGQTHGAAYDGEHAFTFGLDRVLDGVQALVDRRQ
ncbi:TetR/AcrR family transcriptional regulator C-terminal domain-containing protein [Saccharothrix sp. 6-C]|uniref:TetR family transcriptional regulator n=1 Tax=Saccharothrix texasensis TaxID=103734 RepID=A0A3N1GY96_9PSEU|nr:MULTISPECIES: TetR/AcrR family transcriptional regulator [Saccharothrix]QQQ79738.1 TetR/AcrR family transcriptional regulator C-terminal domain-containing protein [Saccharothrix sp. 6-C]ROP35301.1 TetR family transcriptional regulator [Saccharothrix texasensis]